MQRVYEYDLLKGLGILLVLWGHTMAPAIVHNTIYAFHMPLFFFVSGCLYKHDTLLHTAKHKAVRLLIPWLIFAIILSLILGVTEYFKCHTINSVMQFYANELRMGLTGDKNSKCLFGTIWFLICLFEVMILYAAMYKFIKSKKLISIICFALYGGGYLLYCKGIILPFFLDSTMSVIVYFHIGYMFKYNEWDKKDVSVKWSIAGVVAFLALCIILNPYTEIRDNRFQWYILPLSMLAIISLFYLFKAIKMPKSNMFKWLYMLLVSLGIESLIIFGLHRAFFYTMPAIYLRLPIPEYVWTIKTDYIIGIAMVMFSAMACLYLSKFFHKYMPKYFGKQVRIQHNE